MPEYTEENGIKIHDTIAKLNLYLYDLQENWGYRKESKNKKALRKIQRKLDNLKEVFDA